MFVHGSKATQADNLNGLLGFYSAENVSFIIHVQCMIEWIHDESVRPIYMNG